MKATVSFCGLILGLLLTFSSNVFAVSQLKIVCDVDGEKIYVDGKFKSTCDADEPVLVLVSPGKHVVKVKKFNKDGSYYYFRRVIRIGDGIRMTVSVKSEKKYTERYYYNRAKESRKPEDCQEYLKKYPHGKHAKEVKEILEHYYYSKANKSNNPESYIEYLKRYPHGKYVELAKKALETFKSEGMLIKVWDRTFGSNGYDEAYSIVQTKDGGYVVAGYTEPRVDDKDVWVIKLDKNGDKVWDRTFGGNGDDVAESIVQTKDGGYIVAGYTWSKGAGKADAWIIKLVPLR